MAASRPFVRPALTSPASLQWSPPMLSPPLGSPWLPRSRSAWTAILKDPNEFDLDGAGLDDGETREDIMLSEFILRRVYKPLGMAGTSERMGRRDRWKQPVATRPLATSGRNEERTAETA
jgi:hypothetical protein